MLEIERDSGRRHYMIPAAVATISAIILFFMAGLAEEPEATVVALAAHSGLLFIICAVTLAIASAWWIGFDSIPLTALGLVAAALSSMVLFYVFATWVPMAGRARPIFLVLGHGLLLAWLTDIDWQEGLLLGVFNVIMYALAS